MNGQPIVPVIKSNGSIRICGNFKLTVNPHLIMNRHPLPLIEEILASLGGGERFSQIDLSHAYMQIPVTEASREFLTIITHVGLYRYKKLPEDVASGGRISANHGEYIAWYSKHASVLGQHLLHR